MTILKKPFKRELPQTFDRRNWYISIEPWGITFRPKRSRKEAYPIKWETVWQKAQEIAAARLREERKAKRKGFKRGEGNIV